MGGNESEQSGAELDYRNMTDPEVTDAAHGPSRPLPGSLGRMSIFHRLDKYPDPDLATQEKDRLEDLEKYGPTVPVRRTFSDKSRIPELTGQWEDL